MLLTVVLKSNFGEALKWYKCICIYDTTASVDINVFRVNYANENLIKKPQHHKSDLAYFFLNIVKLLKR